jgi:ribonuclease P protein component
MGRSEPNELNLYEANLSTIENPAEAAAWFSEPEFEQERPWYSAESPTDRPETLDARLVSDSMGGSPVSLRLSRSMRIQQTREFRALRLEGSRLSSGCLLANWKASPPGAHARLGVVTSRRVGRAHVRNRARRLLRESFRLHQHELTQPVDMVLVARPSIASKDFHQVERDYLAVLRRARLWRAP